MFCDTDPGVVLLPVKPHNADALYVILGLIGACSLPILPVALELAVEVTRNADGSSAILWAS